MTYVISFFCLSSKNEQQLQFLKDFAFKFHKARNAEFERHYTIYQYEHKFSKPPRVCERKMVRIELCRLPFSFQSSNVKISAILGVVRLGAIYFLIGMFANTRLANTLHTHRVLRSLYKARKMPFSCNANQN